MAAHTQETIIYYHIMISIQQWSLAHIQQSFISTQQLFIAFFFILNVNKSAYVMYCFNNLFCVFDHGIKTLLKSNCFHVF